MKKYFLLGFIFCAFITYAQKVEVSIAGGISHIYTIENHYGNINLKNQFHGNFNTFIFGLRFFHNTHKRFGLRSGIYLTEKGYKFNDRNTRYHDAINYYNPHYSYRNYSLPTHIEFPLLFSLHATKTIDIFAGIGYSLNISRNVKPTNSYFDIPMNIGFTLHRKAMSLDCMYSIGTIPYAVGSNGLNDVYLYTNNQFTAVLGFAINKKNKGCLSCKSMNKKF
jgi:hypothetical protein